MSRFLLSKNFQNISKSFKGERHDSLYFMACGANITNTPPGAYDEQSDIKSETTEDSTTEENTSDSSNNGNNDENVEESTTEEDPSNTTTEGEENTNNSNTSENTSSDPMEYSLPGSYTYTSTTGTATVTNCLSGLFIP